MAKDSRITVFTNPTVLPTGTNTVNGASIDLFQTSGIPAGGSFDSTEPSMGVGVEIIQTQTSGTGQVTNWEWQIAPDNSGSPGTWQNHSFIGTGTMSASGTTAKLRTTLRSRYRWARLVASNTGTGTSTASAYADDMAGIFSTGAAR